MDDTKRKGQAAGLPDIRRRDPPPGDESAALQGAPRGDERKARREPFGSAQDKLRSRTPNGRGNHGAWGGPV